MKSKKLLRENFVEKKRYWPRIASNKQKSMKISLARHKTGCRLARRTAFFVELETLKLRDLPFALAAINKFANL